MTITNEATVALVIEHDTNVSANLTEFINTASALVDWVETCDAAKSDELTDAQLTDIETYIAAHLYAIRDQQYQQKKTGDASATFQGTTGMYLDGTQWGQTAMLLDISGCLAQRNEEMKTGGSKKFSSVWLGTPPSTQVDYVDRD